MTQTVLILSTYKNNNHLSHFSVHFTFQLFIITLLLNSPKNISSSTCISIKLFTLTWTSYIRTSI